METNPFIIFKSYSTAFKDSKIENSYNNRKTMIKPFKIFIVMAYYLIAWIIISFLKLILIYFGVRSYSYEIFWICRDLIMLFTSGSLHFIGNKVPHMHNYVGAATIFAMNIFIVEGNIMQNDTLTVFI